MARRLAPKSAVQSVARALRLMEVLAAESHGIALTLAAERVGLHVVTTHRLLSTLMAHHYVTQSLKTGRYRLSPDAVWLPRAQDGCPLPTAERGGPR